MFSATCRAMSRGDRRRVLASSKEKGKARSPNSVRGGVSTVSRFNSTPKCWAMNCRKCCSVSSMSLSSIGVMISEPFFWGKEGFVLLCCCAVVRSSLRDVLPRGLLAVRAVGFIPRGRAWKKITIGPQAEACGSDRGAKKEEVTTSICTNSRPHNSTTAQSARSALARPHNSTTARLHKSVNLQYSAADHE